MLNLTNMSDTIVIEQPSGLGAFTIGDLGVFIGTLGGVITSILIVLQKSHCKKIKFCCWECDRDLSNIPDDNERQLKQEKKKVIKVPQPEPEPEPEPENIKIEVMDEN